MEEENEQFFRQLPTESSSSHISGFHLSTYRSFLFLRCVHRLRSFTVNPAKVTFVDFRIGWKQTENPLSSNVCKLLPD